MVRKLKRNIQQTTLHTTQSCIYFHQVFSSCVWHSFPHDGQAHCLTVCQVTRSCDSCHYFRITQIGLIQSSCHHTGLCSNYEACLGSRGRTVQCFILGAWSRDAPCCLSEYCIGCCQLSLLPQSVTSLADSHPHQIHFSMKQFINLSDRLVK